MTSHGSRKQKTAVKIENLWLFVPLDAKIHFTAKFGGILVFWESWQNHVVIWEEMKVCKI